jgi:TP901 family phage tail tape measure protein
MPANDVIQRTQQLRDALRKLAESSDDAGTRLGKLESILNGLRDFNFTSMKEASSVLASFNQNVRLMSNDAESINKVTKAFVDLVSVMQKAQYTQQQFSSYGKAGVATKRYTAALGLGDEAAANQQRTAIERQKRMAEDAKRGLANLETYWKEASTMADKIVALRQEFFRRLFGSANLPQLGAGMPSNFNAAMRRLDYGNTYGTMFMGPGENLTGYTPPPPPPQLPSGQRNVPLLGAGEIQEEFYKRPVSEGNIPINLYATSEMNRAAEYISSEPSVARFRRLTTVIDDAVTNRVEQAAEEITETTVSRPRGEIPGETLMIKSPTGKGGGEEDTRNVMYREQVKISEEQLKNIGLTNTAASNLNKVMADLGMTEARVLGNTTELSTGIQTVTFQTKDASGATQNFTAHLDRNGNVLADTQKRFRSFGSAVMRDVVEVLKWTIAISAIYTPIRKVSEMLEEMKKIQLDLVDVQIVLGESTNQFATVLESTAQIATETSSSLEGVIQGYSLAASAAASAGDETQRTVATEKLLKDSMILSKLANIDQKQALDTLVGSLSQLGMGLNDGTKLLDSWVAVSKKANVSVKDMSTSFTIVGSAAQEVGLDFSELNALIGALAQATNLSADELGNAVRGIISTMQTDKAQQAFAEYGIATKTVSGDLRDLMDILKQLKSMSESGILDEKAMGALTQAGGGGARRGAQLSALVKNLDTVMNLVAVSESASGDAAAAMSLEMDTLDAATTRLNNSFSELAITLGTEGGLLDFLTTITNVITSLVKGAKDLTSVLKGAAPVLATFMLARGVLGTQQGASLLNQNIPMGLASLFIPQGILGMSTTGKAIEGALPQKRAPISNWIASHLQRTGIGGVTTGETGARTATVGEFFGGMWNRINRPFFPAPVVSGAQMTGTGINKMSLGTLLGPLLIAASSLMAGGKGAGTRAAVGGGVGVLAGALTGSGVWATVGSIIATAFYDKFLTFSDDMATVWAQKVAENTVPPPDEETPESALARLNREARESMSGWEIFKVNVTNWAMNTWSSMPWRASTSFAGEKTTPEETALGLALLGSGALDEDTRKRIIDAYNKLMRNLAESTEDVNLVSIPQQDEIARLAATASSDLMNEALDQMAVGAAGSIQNYLDAKTLAQKIGSTVTGLLNVQKQIAQPVTIGVGENAQNILPPAGFTPMSTEEAIKFISGLNSEEAGMVVTYYTQIGDLLEKIRTLNEQIAGQTGIIEESQQADLDNYKNSLQGLISEFLKIIQYVAEGSQYRKIGAKLMPTIELPEMTAVQYQLVRDAADRFWTEYLKASGLTDAEIKEWKAHADEQIVTMQQSVSPFRTNIPQEFFTPALEQGGFNQMPGLMDWRQYTMAQFQQAQSQYGPFIQAIQKLLPNFKPDETESLYILKDNAVVQHLDNTIMQMLMRDLIDIEKDKGLQGMYNLPAGATFYVPVTAYELHRQTQAGIAGGGGGLSNEDLLAILQAAIAAGATARLQEAEQQFQQAQATGTNLNEIQPGKGFTFGGQEYKMFGPPVPEGGGNLLGYTVGNPLPVMVTNYPTVNTAQLPETLPPYNPNIPFTLTPEIPQVWTPEQGPISPTVPVPETAPTWFQKLEMFFQNLFQPFGPVIPNNQTGMNTQQPSIQTALNLAVDQKVMLTVDGRTLATIIKPYLYEDLIRYGTTSPSSVSRSVIA